ncbi:hypothetical protein FHW79_001655 [Azospirillum sp. OGB3]|uniref:hypothetical protein n=1 Tax=Azospirillum sp. OGB3 TaxID=2587012 RepID=UPI001606CF9C|nr:hypothetical protein [Azospirillum sp. OGB3]MBB3264040.1 hypothetical protein [Azospirillum sp. OGB3]
MGKPLSPKIKDVGGPPSDQAWVWASTELMSSPAWRARSIYCVRLIEFLQIEHMAHGGYENGKLKATYDQLDRFGIPRKYIKATIQEAEGLRLIEVQQGGQKGVVENHASLYRLTFYHSSVKGRPGERSYYVAPSNEWKTITAEMAREVERTATEARSASRVGRSERSKRSAGDKRNASSRVGNLNGSRVGNSDDSETMQNQSLNEVPYAGTAIYILAPHSEPPGDGQTFTATAFDLETQPVVVPPDDTLRCALKSRLLDLGRGGVSGIARAVGVERSTLSNFAAGRTDLGNGPRQRLIDLLTSVEESSHGKQEQQQDATPLWSRHNIARAS